MSLVFSNEVEMRQTREWRQLANPDYQAHFQHIMAMMREKSVTIDNETADG
jgi:hypothetical protein